MVQNCMCLRHDMGMGKPVIIWLWVCMVMGMGWKLPYLGNTIPISTVLWV